MAKNMAITKPSTALLSTAPESGTVVTLGDAEAVEVSLVVVVAVVVAAAFVLDTTIRLVEVDVEIPTSLLEVVES